VVLSGSGADGASGIERIKERGGVTLVQDPDEAEHAGMPRSAVATGLVDYILPVTALPDALWSSYRAPSVVINCVFGSEGGCQPTIAHKDFGGALARSYEPFAHGLSDADATPQQNAAAYQYQGGQKQEQQRRHLCVAGTRHPCNR
jgi:hypothetical protein